MRISWKLGRVAGIDLFLHPTFLLLLAWGAFQGGLDAVLLVSAVFGCVVLHELGHALTARGFGIATRDITLYPIGGVVRLERMPKAPGAELLITLAGPAVNFAIAAVLALALMVDGALDPVSGGSRLADFAVILMQVNLVLGVFNLIPAFPMDGGRIFRALLSMPLGRYRATEIAAGLGRCLAVALPLLTIAFGMFSPMHLLLAAFVYFAAGAELAQARRDEWEKTHGRSGVWTAPPGYRWVSLGNGFWRLSPVVVPIPAGREPRPWL